MYDAGFDMGFRYSELRNMSLWEYGQHIRAYDRQQENKLHRIRLLASLVRQPHIKGGRLEDVRKLMPLPSDTAPTKRQMSDSDVEADVARKTKLFKKVRGIA